MTALTSNQRFYI